MNLNSKNVNNNFSSILFIVIFICSKIKPIKLSSTIVVTVFRLQWPCKTVSCKHKRSSCTYTVVFIWLHSKNRRHSLHFSGRFYFHDIIPRKTIILKKEKTFNEKEKKFGWQKLCRWRFQVATKWNVAWKSGDLMGRKGRRHLIKRDYIWYELCKWICWCSPGSGRSRFDRITKGRCWNAHRSCALSPACTSSLSSCFYSSLMAFPFKAPGIIRPFLWMSHAGGTKRTWSKKRLLPPSPFNFHPLLLLL